MISDILRTLSDGELMVIADELLNPELDEQLLYRQITSKGNKGETVSDIETEINSDEFRGTLPRLIAIELASRYRPIVQVPVKI